MEVSEGALKEGKWQLCDGAKAISTFPPHESEIS